MNNQQIEELTFWNALYERNKDNYFQLRHNDFLERKEFLPEIFNEKGYGLDYGCGLLSMLWNTGLKFDAIDPLIEEYNKILELGVNYGKNFDKKYDWIWCVNVLDHDKNPENIVDDIKNKLKDGGKVFLEINFDDILSPAHYEIYNEKRVSDLFKDFKKIKSCVVRNKNYPQDCFYAIYEI